MASSGRLPVAPFSHGNRTPARRGGLRRLLLGPVVPTAPVPSSYRTHTTLLPGPGAAAPGSVPILRACAAITAVVRHRTRRDTCRAPTHSIPLRRRQRTHTSPAADAGTTPEDSHSSDAGPRPPRAPLHRSRADPVASNKRVGPGKRRTSARLMTQTVTPSKASAKLSYIRCPSAARPSIGSRCRTGQAPAAVTTASVAKPRRRPSRMHQVVSVFSPVRRATASSSMTT